MTPTDASAMPPVGAEPVKPSAPRWMKVALAVSLAVNLAVAGLVAGAVLKDGPPHRAAAGQDFGFGPFTDALSKADRAALRQGFLSAAPEFRDQRRQARAEFDGVLAALRAVPFDAPGLRALLDAQHARAMSRFEIGRTLIYDRITAMTPEDRAAFADRLEQGLKRGPKDRLKDRPLGG